MRWRCSIVWMVTMSLLMMVVGAVSISAQEAPDKDDTRTEYPPFLSNSFFTINAGLMLFDFSQQQLQPGFRAQSIDVPHLGVRVDLFGHYFSDYVSVQAIYLRPGNYVNYYNINQEPRRQVKEAYGALTLAGHVPVTGRVSAYAEGGWGITTRAGFQVNNVTAMPDVQFGSFVLGGGLEYHATPHLDAIFGATYFPGRSALNEPSMELVTGGFRYRTRPLTDAEVRESRETQYVFPANVVRVGYSTNAPGYGVNDLFTKKIPIFWAGDLYAGSGFTLEYERNVFHSPKRFAFDVGISVSHWTSKINEDTFQTVSVYPLARYFFARLDPADLYVCYSLAGPTYISQTVIDGANAGGNFTFQDLIGLGMFFGPNRRLNAEVGIKHFSNGNLLITNPGVTVPLAFKVGLTF
jgi:hypothetical protein